MVSSLWIDFLYKEKNEMILRSFWIILLSYSTIAYLCDDFDDEDYEDCSDLCCGQGETCCSPCTNATGTDSFAEFSCCSKASGERSRVCGSICVHASDPDSKIDGGCCVLRKDGRNYICGIIPCNLVDDHFEYQDLEPMHQQMKE